MKLRFMIAILILILANLACASTSTGTTGGEADISGEYNLVGTNPDGSAYDGTVSITSTGGTNYDVLWTIGDGSQTQSGAGTLTGTVLSINWTDSGGEATGTATFNVQPDGSLIGAWTVDGTTDSGAETLTPK